VRVLVNTNVIPSSTSSYCAALSTGRLVKTFLPICLFNIAFRHNAKYAPAYFGRGYISSIKGDMTEAIRDYRKALELDSSIVNAWANLGASLAIKREFHEANVAFN